MSKINKIWYLTTAVLLLAVCIASIYVFTSGSGSGNLSNWNQVDKRSGLLENLIIDEPITHAQIKNLNSSSPIHGFTETQVISLLGQPDNSNSSQLIYYIGNVDANLVENTLVRQEAHLYLIFENNKCVKYKIST